MKCEWIKEGDVPSKRLFNKVKLRKARNQIITLRSEDDLWVVGQYQVSNLIVNSLKHVFMPLIDYAQEDHIDLLLQQLHFPSLSPSQSEVLYQPFEFAEIKAAIFYLKGSKSRGPDGCINEFFHTNWETVGYIVTKSVQHFFNTGFLLQELNSTLLIMIPKIDTPELASQFRPISLCNTVDKCIAKCLVHG